MSRCRAATPSRRRARSRASPTTGGATSSGSARASAASCRSSVPRRTGTPSAGPTRGVPGPWSPPAGDGEARVAFTVPASRGTASTVAIIVDGDVVREYDATGAQDQRGRRRRQRRTAQRRAAGVQRVRPLLRQRPPSRCRPTGRSPAPSTSSPSAPSRAAARCAGSSPRTPTATAPPSGPAAPAAARDVTLALTGIGIQEVATGFVDLGYDATEVVTVTLFDDAPSRGSGTATGTPRRPASRRAASVDRQPRARCCIDRPGRRPAVPERRADRPVRQRVVRLHRGQRRELPRHRRQLTARHARVPAVPRRRSVLRGPRAARRRRSPARPDNTLDVRCYVGPLYDAGGDGWVESSYTWPG